MVPVFYYIGVWFVAGGLLDLGCAANDFAIGNDSARKACNVALYIPTPMCLTGCGAMPSQTETKLKPKKEVSDEN